MLRLRLSPRLLLLPRRPLTPRLPLWPPWPLLPHRYLLSLQLRPPRLLLLRPLPLPRWTCRLRSSVQRRWARFSPVENKTLENMQRVKVTSSTLEEDRINELYLCGSWEEAGEFICGPSLQRCVRLERLGEERETWSWFSATRCEQDWQCQVHVPEGHAAQFRLLADVGQEDTRRLVWEDRAEAHVLQPQTSLEWVGGGQTIQQRPMAAEGAPLWVTRDGVNPVRFAGELWPTHADDACAFLRHRLQWFVDHPSEGCRTAWCQLEAALLRHNRHQSLQKLPDAALRCLREQVLPMLRSHFTSAAALNLAPIIVCLAALESA